MLQALLTALATMAALAAAVLWGLSAWTKIPAPKFDDLGPDGDFIKELNRSVLLNRSAALATAVSVMLQFLATHTC